MIDLRLGRWQDVLSDVETCDAVICDPPYGAGTHVGHNDGTEQTIGVTGQATRASISYDEMNPNGMREFVGWACARARGWVVIMTSHDLIPAVEEAIPSDRYGFAPVPVIQKRPRLLGDGPSSWAVYMMVSRPRAIEFSRWGCLPGAYFSVTVKDSGIAGAKPEQLMRAIVRDYTRSGDLIVDPFCGTGTTALACAIEGRSCITSEMDPSTHAIAKARLQRGYTPEMFT